MEESWFILCQRYDNVSERLKIGFGVHPSSLLFNAFWVSILGRKWLGREPVHAPPPSAEVRVERSYTSTPPTCLRGLDRDNITFTFTKKAILYIKFFSDPEIKTLCGTIYKLLAS